MKRKFISLIVFIILIWIVATGFAIASIQIDSVNQVDSVKNSLVDKPVIDNNSKTAAINTDDSKPKKENVGELTLFVNGVNNILTTYGIALAILTLLLAIVGYFSVKPLTDKVSAQEEFIKAKFIEIENMNKNYIASFNLVKNDFANKIVSIEIIEKRLGIQNEYVERSTTYIYDVIYKLVASSKIKDKTLIEKISTDIQILRLFSAKKEDRFASLYYFAENGTKNHVDDIRYVSENDLEEEIRKLALKVIGRIEERESSQNELINS